MRLITLILTEKEIKVHLVTFITTCILGIYIYTYMYMCTCTCTCIHMYVYVSDALIRYFDIITLDMY